MYGEVAVWLHAFITSARDEVLHTLVSSPMGKEAPYPFGSVAPGDWTVKVCALGNLTLWFSTCSAGCLATILTEQFKVSVRHARGMNYSP
jgi:hypothetical protein